MLKTITTEIILLFTNNNNFEFYIFNNLYNIDIIFIKSWEKYLNQIIYTPSLFIRIRKIQLLKYVNDWLYK